MCVPIFLSWEQYLTLQLTTDHRRVPHIYNMLMRIYLLFRAGCEITLRILINLGTYTYICPTYLTILIVKGDISPSN